MIVLGRNLYIIVAVIFFLAYVFVFIKRPDLGKQITIGIFKVISAIFIALYKVIEFIFKAFSKMSLKASMTILIIITIISLFFLARHSANCSCFPKDDSLYKPKSEVCLNVSDSPPKICGYKYRPFFECSVDKETKMVSCDD